MWHLCQDSQDFLPTPPSSPASTPSPTKTEGASASGELLPLATPSLVKAAYEALNLSEVWSLGRVLGPASLHQQN